jgi:hypothetical protein
VSGANAIINRSLEDHNWDQSSKPKKPLAFNNGENSALPDLNAASSSSSSSSMNPINAPQTRAPDQSEPIKPAGPGAIPVADEAEKKTQGGKAGDEEGEEGKKQGGAGLRFFFSPELKKLIFPEEDLLEEGTDT